MENMFSVVRNMGQTSDIPDKIAKLFVKVKYHARIKALNENDILVRGEELRRKAQEQKEAPKKQKTVRDFSKD